jgi:hypothetical protein
VLPGELREGPPDQLLDLLWVMVAWSDTRLNIPSTASHAWRARMAATRALLVWSGTTISVRFNSARSVNGTLRRNWKRMPRNRTFFLDAMGSCLPSDPARP